MQGRGGKTAAQAGGGGADHLRTAPHGVSATAEGHTVQVASWCKLTVRRVVFGDAPVRKKVEVHSQP
jgi:hypothetical protein